MMSPGLDGYPRALIVICTDWELARSMEVTEKHPDVKFDVGMAAENILLACPCTGDRRGTGYLVQQISYTGIFRITGFSVPRYVN